MKAHWLLIVLGMIIGAALGQNSRVAGKQTPDPDPSMTIRGQVANIRIVQGNITFELGGSWRRRFVVVIDETDVLIPYAEVIRRYRNQIIEVDGPVFETRGRFEVHVEDLEAIKIRDRNEGPDTKTALPTVVSSTWPGDFASLAKELKKLQRDIAQLKRIQQEHEHTLSKLGTPTQTKVEHHHYDSRYRDLEHRVHRIEVTLDLVVQSVQ